MKPSSRLVLLALALTALPAAARAQWRSEGPFLATVEAIAVDPSRPATLYAATVGGGVWRSDDAGRSWSLPGGEMIRHSVAWIVVDPGNPATVWAGVSAKGEHGTWRSPDRGKTWAVAHFEGSSETVGDRIVFAESDPRVVFVPSTNLHFRSSDGGETWTSFRVPGQDVDAFAVDPRNPNIVYAGGNGSEHRLSRSDDGGQTWRPIGPGPAKSGITGLVVSGASSPTLYAAAGWIYRSTDGGVTWAQLELGSSEVYHVALSPHDPNVLLAASKDGLRQSNDGGDTWSTVGAGLGDFPCHAIAFDPRHQDVVYAGMAGTGCFRSTDGGITFGPASEGLGASQVDRLYAPTNGAGPIFAQTSAGLFREDAPGAWTEIQAPFKPGSAAAIDGIVFDHDTPQQVYAHAEWKWWRSEDAGRSWSGIEVPDVSMMSMIKGHISEPGFQSLVQDPVDAKTFYSGASRKDEPASVVFKTVNAGKKWQQAGTGIASQSVSLLRSAVSGTVFAVSRKDGVYRTTDAAKSWRLVRPGAVKDLAIDPTKPAQVFVATDKGLFRSTDKGETWTRTSQGLEGDIVTAVAVAPRDGRIFAATLHGVFQSADDGATWASMDGLMNTDVRTLAIAGGRAPRLYAGLAGGSVVSTALP